MGKLTDKVAIVTGASKGWGFEIVKAFVREGVKVTLLDINEDKLKEAVSSFEYVSGQVD